VVSPDDGDDDEGGGGEQQQHGELWVKGSTHTLAWAYCGRIDSVEITLYQQGSIVEVIASEAPTHAPITTPITITPTTINTVTIINPVDPTNTSSGIGENVHNLMDAQAPLQCADGAGPVQVGYTWTVPPTLAISTTGSQYRVLIRAKHYADSQVCMYAVCMYVCMYICR